MSQPTQPSDADREAGADARPGGVSSRLAWNTGATYLQRAVSLIIGFAITPFLINSLTEAIYGYYVLSNSVLQWCTIATTAVGSAYGRYAVAHYARKEYDRMNRVLSAGLTINTVFSVVVVSLVGICALFATRLFKVPHEDLRLVRAVLLVMGTSTAALLLLKPWRIPIAIYERLYINNIEEISIRVFVAIAAVLLFVVYKPSLVLWVGMAAYLPVLSSFLLIQPACKRWLPQMHIRLIRIDRATFNHLGGFAFYQVLGRAGHMFFFASAAIIISNVPSLGPRELTAYDIAARWNYQFIPLAVALSASASPQLIKWVATHDLDKLRTAFLVGTRMSIFMTAIPAMVIMCYAEPFISTWVGQQFTSRSVPVLRLLLMGFLFWLPGMFAYEILSSAAQLQRVTIYGILAGVINVILGVLFATVFDFGLSGVAMGTVIGQFLINMIWAPLLACRYVDIRYRTFMLQVLRLFAISGLVTVAVCLTTRYLIPPVTLTRTLIEITIASLLCWSLNTRLALPREDRRRVCDLMLETYRRFTRKNS